MRVRTKVGVAVGIIAIVVAATVIGLIWWLRKQRQYQHIGKKGSTRSGSGSDTLPPTLVADASYETLVADSYAYLDRDLASKGWKRNTTPHADEKLHANLRQLYYAVYSAGMSKRCEAEKAAMRRKICTIAGMWKMQLGTRYQVREILGARARDWTKDKVTYVRQMDALWAWTYAQYFPPRVIEPLFRADIEETAHMEVMIDALRRDDIAGFDREYPAYHRKNMTKYKLLALHPRVVNTIIAALRSKA